MNALCERKDRGVIRRRGLPGERQRAPDLGGPSRLALPRGPLFLEFTADPAAWEVEDQFLLGPDILVAPVTELGARQRRVYLPAAPNGPTSTPAAATPAAATSTSPHRSTASQCSSATTRSVP